jgi:hypothetical protein
MRGVFDISSGALNTILKNRTEFRGVGDGTLLIMPNTGESFRFGQEGSRWWTAGRCATARSTALFLTSPSAPFGYAT